MTGSVEVVATGLAHPQGPDLLPTGELIFVETYVGRISGWSRDGGLRTIAEVGGAPNGCLVGADEQIYYAQNGWTVGPWIAPQPASPGIGRIRADGTDHEVLAELPDGIGLGAAHDLTWGPDGHLYFSDSGKFGMGDPNPKHTGYLYRLRSDNVLEQILDCTFGYPAGLVFEDSGSLVWTEARSCLIRRRSPDGEISTVIDLGPDSSPEAIRLDSAGNFWVPVMEGLILTISPEGAIVDKLDLRALDVHPLNCIFADDHSLYVIDFGHDLREHPNRNGRVLRAEVGVEGKPFLRAQISTNIANPSP